MARRAARTYPGQPPVPEPRAAMKIRPVSPPRPDPAATFRLPSAPPGVVPGASIAMDEAPAVIAPPSVYAWAAGGAHSEGIGFMGYPYLAELSQRPEYRTPVSILAEEATREWIDIVCAGDGDKADKVKAIEGEFERLEARDVSRDALEKALHFGRSQIYLDVGDISDDEKACPLADSPAKINPSRPLQAIRVVEPLWTYPAQYNAIDPLAADFYRPDMWYVMGKQVHRTRLVTLVPHPVPDMLKPAYAFGGMALTQMLKPYVDNWIRTRASVSDAIHNFSTSVLKTNMASVLSGGGTDDLIHRAHLFNLIRDNRGLMMLDRDTEEFLNVSMPLSNLDKLQAQSQEQMCSVVRVPTVKWFGLSPAGLNASSEGEIKAFHETTAGYQERHLRPVLERLLAIVQLSLFGEIDPSIKFKWRPLWTPDASQTATVVKSRIDGDVALVQANVISPEEARGRLANDPESGYALDVMAVPEQGEGEMGEEEEGE